MSVGVGFTVVGGLAALALALSRKAGSTTTLPTDRQLTVAEVKALSERTVAKYFPRVDPLMLRAMAEIESNRKPDAWRWESHVTWYIYQPDGTMQKQYGDGSTGLMQVLLSTAQWLARDLGARAFGAVPEYAHLLTPEIGMYYGAAYVNWLMTYQGVARSEEFIVRGYNGGPNGINRDATLQHWERYKTAYARLKGT